MIAAAVQRFNLATTESAEKAVILREWITQIEIHDERININFL
jgi:hypothetical protein